MKNVLRYRWSETGTPRVFWIVAILFSLTGLLFAFALPALIASSPSAQVESRPDKAAELLMSFRIAGYLFLAMGGFILILMLISLYIKNRFPGKLDGWYWWINFLGGLMGALVFAVPSTLALPGLYILYLKRPNAFFAANDAFGSKFLLMGAVFSVTGLLVLTAVFFIARAQLRGRPGN